MQPAGVQLTIAKIIASVRIIAFYEPFVLAVGEESADIHAPIWFPCCTEVESFGNLPFECFPGGAGVARPCDCAIAALSGKRGAGEVDDTFFLSDTALSLVDAAGMAEGVFADLRVIEIFFGLADIDLQTLVRFRTELTVPVCFKRLTAVTPPGIHTILENAFVCLFPVHCACIC